MVNITRCAVCGRTIPANGEACAYCESERQPGLERPYLPLTLKLFLMLYGVDLAASFVVASIGSVRAVLGSRPPVLLMTLMFSRMGLSFFAGLGLLRRRHWGVQVGIAFLVVELVGAVLALVHLLDPGYWPQPAFSILWIALFLFLLFRTEVRSYFDPSYADRQEVSQLLQSLERSDSRK